MKKKNLLILLVASLLVSGEFWAGPSRRKTGGAASDDGAVVGAGELVVSGVDVSATAVLTLQNELAGINGRVDALEGGRLAENAEGRNTAILDLADKWAFVKGHMPSLRAAIIVSSLVTILGRHTTLGNKLEQSIVDTYGVVGESLLEIAYAAKSIIWDAPLGKTIVPLKNVWNSLTKIEKAALIYSLLEGGVWMAGKESPTGWVAGGVSNGYNATARWIKEHNFRSKPTE